MSLVMALAAGLEGVRSAVCSQLGAHPIPTPANRARARIGLASILKRAGLSGLSTDFDPSRREDRAVEAVMRRVPSRHRCDSPVCRRIAFIYGDVFDHRHLNPATHAAMGDIFGISNMTFFEHVSRMVRAGHVVDRDGRETYLGHVDRLKLPITFLHGEHNRMFLPASTEATYRLLCDANGPELYARRVIPGYAHLDCWMGARAHEDVFPLAVQELDRHN
jgi:cholesterol oxidase